MLVQGIAEIVLNVHDLRASVEFYGELFELEIISPPELPNVFLKLGPVRAGIPQMLVLVPLAPNVAAFGQPRPLHHFALEVTPAEFDMLAARLAERGVATRSGRHPVIPSRTLYLDDPDGNEVELICMADQALR